jgi:predicted Ser/Thr protein kinase
MDSSSAETKLIGGTGTTKVQITSSVDEGRFVPGTVVGGRYRVAGLLGRGGMGEVYRATDLTLGQVVALKFLPETTATDERALARFYNEVRIARQVTHPNVCRVYDVGQAEGLHYISMEFVDGEDLGSLLRRIGRLPVDKGVETARKLCAGLAAAHEKGVLHRDLKPANVMIDGRGQVIIMDFGLAGLAEQLQGDVRSGTPAYMSPEQLSGTAVTVRSDIYSLGLVLYEIFTGRRAFEAASLIELMQMQERMAPLSITSVARDIDPAVERVVLRCLERDAEKRPGSALAVAAALPGGDPLAAAIAAGETPSPDLLAAAGETEGLAQKVALAWMGAAVALLAIAVAVSPGVSVTSKVNLEASPDALSRDARTFVKNFGYTAKPADSAWGLVYDQNFLDWSRSHPKEAGERWRNPGAGQPPLVKFWYRESQDPLTAVRQFNTALSYGDPPMEQSGMVRLQTDPAGKLISFEAVPPQVEKPATPVTPLDWKLLFQAAGLDMAAFQPAEALWTPLASWDARAAWTGTDAVTGIPLRVEAAAWRGRPVFFHIIGPWTPRTRTSSIGSSNQWPIMILIYAALIAACVLAWYNLRHGKADQRGALRLAMIYTVCMAAGNLLLMHHTATRDEMTGFWTSVSTAILNGGVEWVFYVALEPWVRRKWPQTMISWTRYCSKGPSDPLVGRDLLYGTVLGLILALMSPLSVILHGNFGRPLFPPLIPLMGVRQELATVLLFLPAAIFSAVLFLFVLFLMRLLLRKEWIAGIVYALLLTLATAAASTTPLVDVPLGFLSFAIFAWALLRYGMLAAIVASTVSQIVELGSILDFSAWYAGMAALPFVLLLAIAVYGCRTSLGGRPLFQAPEA